ncbi:MAG: rod shape-determining protein MreB [Candidatus Berkelbacteria bacterium Licking1014_96]|uniref:Cell shape-determining protein MreB n=1 Tax=Candidatus Berkelbacteria bacterium Licking1014_96 TaxID=2017149 RepID=A0A554LGW4_9BACT|nr:MAG: rod shape-determining protein MreB [Candidatus Berkelbacteria bacterium Licking1014_96]
MAKRIAIDLGTTNTLVYVPKKGIIFNEPTVVAISAETDKILAVGKEAKEMIGRTPESIIASHPLRDGVIANYRVTEAMLRYYINKVSGAFNLFRPEVMVSVPAGVTSTERRAVVDATLAAGAREAHLIKEPVAAALGAGVPIGSASGNMIIDIGGGTSEVAVIALGDIVVSTSVRVGGNKMDEAITDYIRRKHKLIIGERTAEKIKIKVGTAMPLRKEKTIEISGSNSITSLPESLFVGSNDIPTALESVLKDIISAVKSILQKTPPELAADVIDKGIIMSGGGSKLRRIDDLFSRITGVPCQLAEKPLLCVVKGTGMALEQLDEYKKSVLWIK